jgi:hypothetical protein
MYLICRVMDNGALIIAGSGVDDETLARSVFDDIEKAKDAAMKLQEFHREMDRYYRYVVKRLR